MLKEGGNDDEIETTQQQQKVTISSHEQHLQPPPTVQKMDNPSDPPPAAQTKPFRKMQAKVTLIPEGRKGQLNTQYLATFPGILKVAEVILGFVTFILVICADRRSTSTAWTEHITFETTIIVCLLILLYVVFPHMTLMDDRTREGLIVVEFLFYGLNTLFFFIGIWLMVHLAASWTAEGRGAAIMSAILCLALCVVYAVETYIKFKEWNTKSATMRPQSPQLHQHPVVPIPILHQSTVEKERSGKDEREVV